MRWTIPTAFVVAMGVSGAVTLAAFKSAGSNGAGGERRDLDAGARPLDAFPGIAVASHATDLHAPDGTYRISGAGPVNNRLKVLELAPDGAKVRAGDMLVRFEFLGNEEILGWIQQRLAEAEAEAAAKQLEAQQKVDALRLELRRKQIAAELAAIDVQKERSVSRRQAEIHRIGKRLADFEVIALERRIASAERARRAERAFWDTKVERIRSDLDHFRFHEKRFTLESPHDGIVRYAFQRREGRKVQPGDSIGSGWKIVSVARDDAVEARFFVPEHRISEVEVGARALITTTRARTLYPATVKSIDHFPQELGYLLENEDPPNAREKAFAVRAELVEPAEGLTPGTEILVRLDAPTRVRGGRR